MFFIFFPLLFPGQKILRILITLGRGRRQGRGLPEASGSENLEPDSTRPAPPEGGAANLKGFAPCRRPLRFDDLQI